MINVLCLESKNNMVSTGQIFKASLFMLVNSSKISPKKWQVTAPIDAEKTNFTKLFTYDNCKVLDFIHDFLKSNNYALSFIALSDKRPIKVSRLLDISAKLEQILTSTYINVGIPTFVPIEEINKYIKIVSEQICKDIKYNYEVLTALD